MPVEKCIHNQSLVNFELSFFCILLACKSTKIALKCVLDYSLTKHFGPYLHPHVIGLPEKDNNTRCKNGLLQNDRFLLDLIIGHTQS